MKRLLIILLLSGGLHAEFDKVATTVAPFLKLGVGARATALGGAQVARPNDGFAAYWNPAGMLTIGNPTVAFSINDWALDIKHQYVGVILPTGPNGRLGLAITALTMGEQEVTTVMQPDGTGLTYGVTDLALGLSYARQVSDRLQFGGTAKVIHLSAYNEQANTMAVDLGSILQTDFHGLTIGMSLSNFGGELRYTGRDLITTSDLDSEVAGNYPANADLRTESWPLPLLIRIGIAMDLIGPSPAILVSSHSRLSISLDGDHPNDGPEHLKLGAEYGIRERLYLRGGYRINYDEEALTLGFGLRLDLGGLGETHLDYAIKPMGPFGTTSVLGMELRW